MNRDVLLNIVSGEVLLWTEAPGGEGELYTRYVVTSRMIVSLLAKGQFRHETKTQDMSMSINNSISRKREAEVDSNRCPDSN